MEPKRRQQDKNCPPEGTDFNKYLWESINRLECKLDEGFGTIFGRINRIEIWGIAVIVWLLAKGLIPVSISEIFNKAVAGIVK